MIDLPATSVDKDGNVCITSTDHTGTVTGVQIIHPGSGYTGSLATGTVSRISCPSYWEKAFAFIPHYLREEKRWLWLRPMYRTVYVWSDAGLFYCEYRSVPYHVLKAV